MIEGMRTVAAVVPPVKPADVRGNVEAMIAAAAGLPAATDVVVFPELCVTGATCGDLFLQRRLLDEADTWATELLEATQSMDALVVFGVPVRAAGRVFDAAAVAQAGRLLGIVPKTSPTPAESRWFAPAAAAPGAAEATLGGQTAPFGADLLFCAEGEDDFRVAIEIGSDRTALPPPSLVAALAGATVVCNPAAEPAVADGAPADGADIVAASRRLGVAHVRANAGVGESSSAAVYPGDALVAAEGERLASGARFALRPEPVLASVDTLAIAHRRAAAPWRPAPTPVAPFREIAFRAAKNADGEAPATPPARLPFVPEDALLREERCREVFAIQTAALATRLRNTGIRHVVLGLSGGLDSTLALLVSREAFRQADLPEEGIHVLTMPGFGTGARTRSNADELAEALGLALEEIPVVEACALHLRDIGHDGETPDAAYENSQARERTQILMDRANMVGGLVVGTGDLSEIALGWCTFGGDQLSMYAVNAGVPKTLMRAIVSWYADQCDDDALAEALRAVVETPVSPELLPTDENGDIAQKTESVVGPYELHDFFLWHLVRDGAEPSKLRALAAAAFGDDYAPDEIDRWLHVFLRRFLSQQFKRAASPEGPAPLSVSLDPRDGWRMPGDVQSSAWDD